MAPEQLHVIRRPPLRTTPRARLFRRRYLCEARGRDDLQNRPHTEGVSAQHALAMQQTTLQILNMHGQLGVHLLRASLRGSSISMSEALSDCEVTQLPCKTQA
jgi:hypothetical protein